MKYNTQDGVWYCTSAERTAKSASILADASQDTSKYYEVETKLTYIVYSSAWYLV